MKSFVAFVMFVVLIVSTALPATAQGKCLNWTHPGQDANQRSVEQTVADMNLPTKEDEAKVVATMDRIVVRVEPILAEISKLGNKGERERFTKLVLATNKKLFAKEAVEKLGLPKEMVQTILVNANLDTSMYEAEAVGAGYRTGEMVFAKDKKADCVVLQPAPGQPQTIVVHHFSALLSDGNIWDFDHSTICSNVSKKGKRPGPKAAAPPPPAASIPTTLKPPRDSYTDCIMVWEIIETAKPGELTSFEKEIQSKQSRELGEVVNEEMKKPEGVRRIRPLQGKAGTFDIELHDLNWSVAPGTKMGLNNEFNYTPGKVFPSNFGPNNNMVEVEVKDGEGQLTFERKITLEGSYQIIRAPAGLGVVHPHDKTLNTCVLKTSGKCAGTDLGKWYRETQKFDWVRYHFFVKK